MDRRRSLPPAPRPPALQDGVTLRALLAVLRRRRWTFLIPAVVVTAGFAAAALLLPPSYRATALLAAEPTAAGGAEGADAATDLAGHLGRVAEIVHRRSLLEPVIRDFGLYPGHPAAGVRERELEAMRERITVAAAGPSTFTLGFVDRSPERAARVAARLTARLIAATGAEREERSGATTGFLGGQLASLSARIAEQKRALEAYQERFSGELPEKDTSMLALSSDSQERLHESAGAIAQLEARRSAIESELAAIERHDVAADPAAARRAELERDLERLRARYTDEHPEVARARAALEAFANSPASANGAAAAAREEPSPLRLRQLELIGEREEVARRLDGAYAERPALIAEAAGYRRRAEAAPRHALALAAMTRELEATEARYQELALELDGARQAQRLAAASQAGYRVLEPPRVPGEPFTPHRLRLALMGLAIGLGLGAAAGFFTEQLDTSVRDFEDVESPPTSLPVLAAIPSLPPGRLRRLGPPSKPAVALLDDPHGAAGEQYRILAAKLIDGGAGPRPTTLLVTSPVAGEGKTTTAVNLALALARMMKDEAVLLVDADFGRPAVHRLLRLPRSNGLGRLLDNPDDDPGRYVRYHQGLYLLEAGEATARTRAALASPLAQRVFQRLRQRFAYIVVDAPPVLTVAEGLILQRMVDSILLVVRARVTPRELVRRAVESLDLSRLAGILLNDVGGGFQGYGYPYPYFDRGDGFDRGDAVPAAGGGA